MVRDSLPAGSRNANLSPVEGSPPVASSPSSSLIVRITMVPETIRNGMLVGKKVRTASPEVRAQSTSSTTATKTVAVVARRNELYLLCLGSLVLNRSCSIMNLISYQSKLVSKISEELRIFVRYIFII